MLRRPSELTQVRPSTLQPQVGAVGLDPQLAGAAQPLDQARLERAQLAPGRGGVVAVEERRAADEVGELGRAHAGPLGARGGRPERAAPAPPQAGLADRRAGAGGARHSRRVDARQRRHVLRRLDRQRGVGVLGLRQLGGREPVEVRVLRGRPPLLGRSWQLGAQQRPGAALEQLALDREQQRRRKRGRAHDDLLPGPRVEAVAAEQPGERVGVRRHGAGLRGTVRRPVSPGGLTAAPCPGSAPRGARAAPRGSSGARPGSRGGSGRAAPSGA